jgi:hypothetical protein
LGLSQPSPVRRATRPPDGQNCRLTSVRPHGPTPPRTAGQIPNRVNSRWQAQVTS